MCLIAKLLTCVVCLIAVMASAAAASEPSVTNKLAELIQHERQNPTQPPQLPLSFSANVSAKIPFGGSISGPIVEYDIMLPKGPCQKKILNTPEYSFVIPPFARFVGYENINSKNCQHWTLSTTPFITDFYVAYDNSQGSFVMVRYAQSTEPNFPMQIHVQMDYSDVRIGEQPGSLFNIWKAAGCPYL